ncbi:MAG: glycosyltransferase family 39 protein [Chloroflexi bacterium]|nr:glycosyltransferase family 39 protein [Chloroflexota bacterium]
MTDSSARLVHAADRRAVSASPDAGPARGPAQQATRSRGWSILAEAWPLLLLAAVAVAVRLPNLWYIPQFTDEVFDAQVSYGIYQGKRPLIGVNAYTGAFHYYLQAGLFWLFGPSIYIPRLLVMVLGVGAVVATALLGAEIARRTAPPGDERAARRAGRIGGLVAGGLLATSAVHVLTNSHLAWPHCTVLLYLTLAFWLVERSIRRQSGFSLAWAGLAFGLAQQQHPTMLLLWPVFLGYVGWRGRAFFRTRWAYAAIGAFLIGISPLLAYNLIVTDFGTLEESQAQRSGYQQGRDKDFSYQGRASEILLTAVRIPAGAIDDRPGALAYLADPMVIAYTSLCVAGLAYAARLGAWSPLLAVLSFLLLLPLFPASHDNLPRQGRYLMPLLPLAFAGVGALAAGVVRRARTLGRTMPHSAARPLRVVVAAALALIVVYPLLPLALYEARVLAANETNDRYFVTLGALERQRHSDEPVVLDPTLQRDRTGAAGTAQRTFDFMLTMREIPGVTIEQSSDRVERRISTPTALVLADQSPSSIGHANNRDAWTLEPLQNDAGGGFTLWRITRR